MSFTWPTWLTWVLAGLLPLWALVVLKYFVDIRGVPVSYNYRSLIVRWKTTLMTALGFTLVVFGLVVMLAFINGITAVCRQSGEPENVIVLSKGAADEVLSSLTRDTISSLEHIRDEKGLPGSRILASREMFLNANRFNPDKQDYTALQLRGVQPIVFQVHTAIRVIKGRALRAGQSEVMIGRSVETGQNLHVGDTFEMGRKRWRVCGVFDAQGSALESEVWCDLSELASQFKREGAYSTVVLRTPSAAAAQRIAESLGSNRQMNVEAYTEPQYYAKQAEQMQTLQLAAWVIAWFMGTGAVFGVMTTMFAAIGQRIKDIAVMRIMGFQARAILVSFLIEAALISVIGGALGSSLGFLLNGLSQNANIGSRTVEFSFQVDIWIVIYCLLFSIVMGIGGGLLPAMSAMRIKPLEALR